MEIHADVRRCHVDPEGVSRVGEIAQVRGQRLEIAAKIDLAQAVGQVEHLMDQRHGFDAVAQFRQLKRDRPVRHALPLQLQRVADGGEAVLDPEVLYQDAAGSKFGRLVAAGW